MPSKTKGENTTATRASNQEEKSDFLAILKQLNLAPPSTEPTASPTYKFWRTQPVVRLDEVPVDHGYIDGPHPMEKVRQVPLNLPQGYCWSTIDLTNPSELSELHGLLRNNYCEDNGGRFRLDYTPEFIQWALMPPGYIADWHVGIRQESNNKLLAFISGTPKTIRVYDDIKLTCEVNYLCVHKKLRNKRLAPVLIKEIHRRVNVRNVWRAVYTGASKLPTPVATSQSYHRALNTKKCVEVGYAHCPPNVPLTHLIKANKLPEEPLTPGFQPLQAHHIPQVAALFRNYQAKFDLTVVWPTEDEVAHWFLPRSGIVESFVVVDATTNQVTDFCSYYVMSMQVLGHPKHSTFHNAYSFYNVAASQSIAKLMQDLLIVAKANDIDNFSAVDIMDIHDVLEPMQFVLGSGHLYYYLFNWRCPPMEPKQVSLVMF